MKDRFSAFSTISFGPENTPVQLTRPYRGIFTEKKRGKKMKKNEKSLKHDTFICTFIIADEC